MQINFVVSERFQCVAILNQSQANCIDWWLKSISYETALGYISLALTDGKSKLLQVLAWRHQEQTIT